jgi:beta-galactosidase
MKHILILCGTLFIALCFSSPGFAQQKNRQLFNEDWKFILDSNDYHKPDINDDNWRSLNLPHDWSIELPFDSTSPTGTGGGALRGGVGWYRKTFLLPAADKNKTFFIDFDGVYCNSEVWINGHYLGKRPNGYVSFRYDLTTYLKFGTDKNVIAVKADNSRQPNSRWYSGSGIYRNVWLVKTNPVFVDHWGTFITTPKVNDSKATVNVKTKFLNTFDSGIPVTITTALLDADNKVVATNTVPNLKSGAFKEVEQSFQLNGPKLWSIERPYLYTAITTLIVNNSTVDEYSTTFGIRYFHFDADKGFFLNNKPVKIIGVCNHHDLGCLGTAINTRALARQLEVLKGMGINGIRTSHNPPAPELLDLCDKMGFIVMDEAFDIWKRPKNKYDYHLAWDEWHKKDLQDQVLRDRNHPSVFMWSLGNEIPEQWSDVSKGDSSGKVILRELVAIVHALDTTRLTVTANNQTGPFNALLQSNAADVIGYNYNHRQWDSAQYRWGKKPFLITESVSALQTRGSYDMPSDSIRRWPSRWDRPVQNANADLSCSSYENCSTPWGSTHEETLKVLLKYDHIGGMFTWTGFDYMGEPTPYPWPARSSYFGIVDLAGFPKDVYYLYQSLFTEKTVLHVFPHWNWPANKIVDVWAYYNNADEVELFLNGKSLGTRKKQGDDLHVMWRVNYEPGTIKAVARKNGATVLEKEVRTAGKPYKLVLMADRNSIKADGNDLSFVTVRVEDKDGNLVPHADNLIHFVVKGNGFVAAVDNGSQTSMESFRGNKRKAFNGMALAVVQSEKQKGNIELTATSEGLQTASVNILSQ